IARWGRSPPKETPMGEVVIRLVVNKATGKKDVIISYASDADALPVEHEDEHRRVVDRLLEGGALRAAELGDVVIERVQGEPPRASTVDEEPSAGLAIARKG